MITKLKVEFIRLTFPPYGKGGEIIVDGNDPESALNQAFAAFHRGSGAETQFDGPSASVGDVFIVNPIDDDGVERHGRVFLIMPFGFEEINALFPKNKKLYPKAPVRRTKVPTTKVPTK